VLTLNEQNPMTGENNMHAMLDQLFTTRDFQLVSGRVLPELRIAYDTYGTAAVSCPNAVLLTHGYTSSHHMVGSSDSTLSEGLWNSLVGPGKAIDTDRLYVVSSNMLGSCYGSTGPAQQNPLTGRPYGPDFPDITLVDIVTAQRALLKHLGVEHLIAVIGPSYGGFQAFQWAVTFPDFLDGIVPVTTDFKAPGNSVAGLNATIARLETDPNWHGGHYYDHGGVPDTMTRIRVDTLVDYCVHELLAAEFPDPAARQTEIERMARKWAMEFDANSLIVLGRAMARFNLQNDLTRIKARVLYVLSRTDRVFPPALAPGVMAKLQEAAVWAEYFEIDSELGHAAPGLDGTKWAAKLAEFKANSPRRLEPGAIVVLLLRQLDVPVRLADERRPACDPQLVGRVPRVPRRLDWLLAQSHSGLLRRAVGLPLVARQAGQYAVVPPRLTALGPRDDVVDRQFLTARLPAAVLARVVATLENVPPAERHGRRRQPVVGLPQGSAMRSWESPDDRTSHCCSPGTMIIQVMLNLSATIPKQGDQKVSVSGITTLPPFARELNAW
jgi:homoserine O-acetyltransferase